MTAFIAAYRFDNVPDEAHQTTLNPGRTVRVTTIKIYDAAGLPHGLGELMYNRVQELLDMVQAIPLSEPLPSTLSDMCTRSFCWVTPELVNDWWSTVYPDAINRDLYVYDKWHVYFQTRNNVAANTEEMKLRIWDRLGMRNWRGLSRSGHPRPVAHVDRHALDGTDESVANYNAGREEWDEFYQRFSYHEDAHIHLVSVEDLRVIENVVLTECTNTEACVYLKMTDNFGTHIMSRDPDEWDTNFVRQPFCNEGFRRFVRLPDGARPREGNIIKLVIRPKGSEQMREEGDLTIGSFGGLRRVDSNDTWVHADSIYQSFFDWMWEESNVHGSTLLPLLHNLTVFRFEATLCNPQVTPDDATDRATAVLQRMADNYAQEVADNLATSAQRHPGWQEGMSCTCLPCLTENMENNNGVVVNTAEYDRVRNELYPPTEPTPMQENLPEDADALIKEIARLGRKMELMRLRSDRIIQGIRAYDQKEKSGSSHGWENLPSPDADVEEWVEGIYQNVESIGYDDIAVAAVKEGFLSAYDVRTSSNYSIDWYDDEEVNENFCERASEMADEIVAERLEAARDALDG
jgi:hypothetical protein